MFNSIQKDKIYNRKKYFKPNWLMKKKNILNRAKLQKVIMKKVKAKGVCKSIKKPSSSPK